MKKCWLLMVEVDMCFPKNTKIGMLQYGIVGPQKGGSDTLTISGLQQQHLNIVAPVANFSPSPSILLPASTETATVSLSSPVTSTLASPQASSSQCISFEDPRQGWETVFELNLRSQLPKKISMCRGNCHNNITQSDCLLVRLYGISSWLNRKTDEERSRHGPL